MRTADDVTFKTPSAFAVVTLTLAVMPGLIAGSVLSSANVTWYSTTLLDTVDVSATAMTCAANSWFGIAFNVTVAAAPTVTFDASASSMLATTWRPVRFVSVRKVDELDDDEEAACAVRTGARTDRLTDGVVDNADGARGRRGQGGRVERLLGSVDLRLRLLDRGLIGLHVGCERRSRLLRIAVLRRLKRQLRVRHLLLRGRNGLLVFGQSLGLRGLRRRDRVVVLLDRLLVAQLTRGQ